MKQGHTKGATPNAHFIDVFAPPQHERRAINTPTPGLGEVQLVKRGFEVKVKCI